MYRKKSTLEYENQVAKHTRKKMGPSKVCNLLENFIIFWLANIYCNSAIICIVWNIILSGCQVGVSVGRVSNTVLGITEIGF